MCRHNRHIVSIFIALLLMPLMPRLCAAGFKKGDALPDLAGFKLEGKLPDKLKGQVILLDFWASWCAPCKSSFPAMEELNKLYRDKGLTIVAVSVDEKRENMDRFLKSVAVTFATAWDAGQKLVGAADVSAMPTSFLIDRAGKIRFIHNGFRGDETIKQYKQEIELLLKEKTP